MRISTLCVTTFAGLALMTAFGAERSDVVTSYTADVNVMADGVAVATPTFVADFGSEVELTVGGSPGKSGWKIRTTAASPVVGRSGEALVGVRMQLFEIVGTNEILRAEPALTARVGDKVDFEVPLGGAPGHRATIGLTIRLGADAAIGGRLFSGPANDETCPSLKKGVIGVDAARQCCGGRCSDGEPWTCCGATTCCLCGSCCSP